jgi:hypothetical protein
MPSKLSHRFKLKPDALQKMADAIGETAYSGRDGQPSRSIVLGTENRSTARKMLAGLHNPSGEAVATITKRHAANRNIPWPDALVELFDIVEDSHDQPTADDVAVAA